MANQTNARSVGRPAQGRRTDTEFNRPRPAYKPSLAPQVVGSGSVSRPTDTRWSGGALKLQATDATPKVVTL